MFRHFALVGGIGIAAVFVVVFFAGRTDSKNLDEVAPRVGLSSAELLAMGPRIASSSGGTLGSARRVVFLLACSGLATRSTFEAQAAQAGALARRDRLTDREAVLAVLAQSGRATPAQAAMKGC